MSGSVNVKVDYTRYMTFDRKQVRAAMRKGAQLVRKEAKKLASQRRGITRGTGNVTASAPGQPPLRVSSALWRSIYGRASRRGYALVAGTIAPHSHLLEMGTRHMEARPLMPAALGAVQDQVIGFLRDAVGQGLVAIDGSVGTAPKSVEVG